jgi:hypothetical protein
MGEIRMDVTIPVNTTADIHVPDKENRKVQFLNGNEPEYLGYAGERYIFRAVQGKYSLRSEIY